jgi:hypothetical protein
LLLVGDLAVWLRRDVGLVDDDDVDLHPALDLPLAAPDGLRDPRRSPYGPSVNVHVTGEAKIPSAA